MRTPLWSISLLSVSVVLSSPSRVADELVSGPAMSVARMAHRATPLADGRVLVTGGFADPAAAARSAEAFDARTGRFTALPPMHTTRYSHTATLLANGQVLIVGGYTPGGTSRTAELFDPRTNRFTPTGSLRSARADHIAVPLADGRVLIAGGLGPDWTFLASAELYDPRTGTFSRTGDLTVPRESHVGVRLTDGRVFVVGGHRGRREQVQLYTSAEMYDPRTRTFRAVGDMRVRRHKHDAILLRDGRVLISGGSDERDDQGAYTSTELFDPRTNTFTMGPSLQRTRYKHAGTSTLLANGNVLMAGGNAEAELYDVARNRFAVVTGAPRMAGQFSAVSPLPNGGVLITGGYGGGTGPRASAWVYRP
jgi:hypothetical protein